MLQTAILSLNWVMAITITITTTRRTATRTPIKVLLEQVLKWIHGSWFNGSLTVLSIPGVDSAHDCLVVAIGKVEQQPFQLFSEPRRVMGMIEGEPSLDFHFEVNYWVSATRKEADKRNRQNGLRSAMAEESYVDPTSFRGKRMSH